MAATVQSFCVIYPFRLAGRDTVGRSIICNSPIIFRGARRFRPPRARWSGNGRPHLHVPAGATNNGRQPLTEPLLPPATHVPRPPARPPATRRARPPHTDAGSGGAHAPTWRPGSGGPAPPTRTVNPGDRVNIPCPLANAGGSIQFAKDEQPVILDSGCAHCQLDISNEGQASLTINRVGRRDQGQWQCWRLDAAGKVKQRLAILRLQVSESPELPVLVVNERELAGANNLDATVSVRENELVTFKCLIRGAATPVDYVHWMLDSSQNVSQRSQLMMEYSAQDNSYLTQSVLKLNATKAMNLKSVSCLSKHQLWLTPMTVTAFLNVLYEPSFTISREPGFGVPVSEGMTVILKCEIDSNPSSSPVWIRDADNRSSAEPQQSAEGRDGQAPGAEPIQLDSQEDGSLLLQPVQRADSGWYRCKTDNKYGNFSSFGYYLNVKPAGGAPPAAPDPRPPAARLGPGSAPRLLAPNQAAAQVAGAARARPADQAWASSSSNMINNDQPAAQAEARCKAAAGAPQLEQPLQVVPAALGRQLVLSARFCCQPQPSRVFWVHRHLAMVPGRMFGPYITRDVLPAYSAHFCYESTFEIEAVKPEDIGTVFMFVSNERGVASAELRLQLVKPTDPASQLIASRFPAPTISSSGAARRLGSWPIELLVCASLQLICMHALGRATATPS